MNRKKVFTGIIATALVLSSVALISLNILIDTYEIVGPSMEPFLKEGEKVKCWKFSKNNIKEGDVVVVKEEYYFNDMNGYFVKRVVATENDRIAFVYNSKGKVSFCKYIDNSWQVVDEHFIKEPMHIGDYGHFDVFRNINDITDGYTIGKDQYFVLGDNRNFSVDSRKIGCIYKEHIVGVVWQ